MSIKMDEVAKYADVSMKTVSRVVNGEAGVNATTREKVLKAIADLGYVPHTSARRLAQGRAGVIGLVLPNVASPYTNILLETILTQANRSEYGVLVNLYPGTKNEQILNLFLSRQIDGVIVGAIQENVHQLVDEFNANSLPFVLLEPNLPEKETLAMPVINITDREGVNEAVTYLIKLGHRRIGFVSCSLTHETYRNRLYGYQDALQLGGLAYDPFLMIEGDGNFRSGYQGLEHLLTLKNPPSAVFVSNDSMAIGGMFAARKLGKSIPEDLSIVGFDDIPMAEQMVPPLTTIRNPVRELGEKAVDVLLTALQEGTNINKSQKLATRMIIRETCRKVS